MRTISLCVALLLLAIPSAAQRQSSFKVFDALTAAGQTAAFDTWFGASYPLQHTVQLTISSLPATCTVQLEGCLLGRTVCTTADWEVLSTAHDCTSVEMFHVINRPVRNIRVNLTALAGTGATAKAPVETLDETDFGTHASWDVTGGFVDSGTNAVYTHTPLEVLTELDFATHANWNVTTGFDDSGNNAAYIHAPSEVLTELDFGTHANWDVTAGFDDSATNAAYLHTVLQILTELDFASHANWDVTVGFVDSATNAVYTHTPAEVLVELDFASHVFWDVFGDMTDSTGAAVYTHGGGVGTLTLPSGDFDNAMVADVGYLFGYAVTGFTSDVACDITTAIASTTTALTMANGSQTTTFTSASVPGDFIISCASTSGGVTIDDVTLTRADHTATLTQQSANFANPGVDNVSYVLGTASLQ